MLIIIILNLLIKNIIIVGSISNNGLITPESVLKTVFKNEKIKTAN